MIETYNFKVIEQEIQKFWEEKQCFKVSSQNTNKKKYYVLSMLPYPSGALHMGHVRNYTIGDVIARYKKMIGKNVLHPVGWDAFGLPAENAAIKNSANPDEWICKNISYMKKQLKKLGFGYDWNRELITSDSNYFKWEQWIFIKLFNKGLIYRKQSIVNWDPVDKTVLANEQVINGKGWRSGALVQQKDMPQWFIKSSKYSDELLDNLKLLKDWPINIKTMQKNWIGKSYRLELKIKILNFKIVKFFLDVPELIMGITYAIISPDHDLAKFAATINSNIKIFIKDFKETSSVKKIDIVNKNKKGIKLENFHLIHPITNVKLEIWIVNYMFYENNSKLCIPAHDKEDYYFANKYNINIIYVIKNSSKKNILIEDFTQNCVLKNSNIFNNLKLLEASIQIKNYILNKNFGKEVISFKIRDWCISRQRYWGCPIPIIYCESCGCVTEKYENLPVNLPPLNNLHKNEISLSVNQELYNVNCPKCNKKAIREKDTLDTFIESSWYYAKYTCPKSKQMLNNCKINYWFPIDQYIGGIEHAVLHLLYARIFYKLMIDINVISIENREPFQKIVAQGMILKNGSKMSKSKNNIINPIELINKYGADSLRLFIIFAAPIEKSLEWNDSGIKGVHKFLHKLWNYCFKNRFTIFNNFNVDISNTSQENILYRIEIYKMINLSLENLENNKLNTVVSYCMKIFNIIQNINDSNVISENIKNLLQLLSPFAPHISQYLWKEFDFGENILNSKFIQNKIFTTLKYNLIVQINGKTKILIKLIKDLPFEKIKEIAINKLKIKGYKIELNSKIRIIYIKNKVINFVDKFFKK